MGCMVHPTCTPVRLFNFGAPDGLEINVVLLTFLDDLFERHFLQASTALRVHAQLPDLGLPESTVPQMFTLSNIERTAKQYRQYHNTKYEMKTG